ncbi:MAG: restriction endonuclease subunit S [Candidatus Nitrosocaldaceae archaeon]
MSMQEDNLPRLPDGWVWVRLGDICLDPQYGWTTRAKTNGTLHLLRTTDITSGQINWNNVPFCEIEPPEPAKYLLNDGDILISRAGSIGSSIMIKNPPLAIFASYLIRFRTLIDVSYLAYFLQSPLYWKSISEKKIGITIPNINATKLKQIMVPLPPLQEQKRIVTKLEELFSRLDAGVEALKKAREQVKRYRQSVLKKAFEGRLTEQWRITNKDRLEPASILLERIKEEKKKRDKKFKELEPLDTSGLPRLPDGWVWVRVSDICYLINGRVFKPNEWSASGLPIVRIQNLNNPNASFNYCNFDVDTKYIIDSGQLLFAWSGTPITSFGAHIWRGGKAVLNQHIFRVEMYGDYINKYYLMYVLNHNVVEYINKAHGGVGLAHITKMKFESSFIPLPPLQEQKRIVEEIERLFSIADHAEKIIEHSLAQADRLRQSILKKAFEGKLVPQDPTDEPASMLLEKIKLEKATKIKSSNNRRSINNNHDNNSSNYDHIYMADLRMEKYEYDGKRMMAKGRTKRGGRGKGRGRRRKRYTVMDDEHQMRLI